MIAPSPTTTRLEAVARRAVVACLDGGDLTSNAGALLLGQVDCGAGRAGLRRASPTGAIHV